MEIKLLPDIIIILGLSVIIILAFQRFKIPTILGFLITGTIVGPHGLNLIKAVHEVELMSEIGIIFLLFIIGIEFSLKGLSTIRKTVLVGGSLQVCGTISLVTVLCYSLGLSLPTSIFMGFLFSLSSTAIVLKLLQEKGELTSPHGRVSIGILIFQDIAVVFMILLTPILAGHSQNPEMDLLFLFGKVIAVVIAIIVLSRYVVPVLFKLVVKTKSQELFILTIVVLCFATAWLTSISGLSLALGAFFAGLIISESDYSHHATANILPFREIFVSFFFVSVGMLLDFTFFIENFGYILIATLSVILVKMVVICLSVYVLKYPPRTVFISSLIIFQVGEFAFLLSKTGMDHHLLSNDIYQYFLAISVITIGASPFIINLSPQIASFIIRTPLPKGVRNRLKHISARKVEINKRVDKVFHDHLVVVGYGINGENVSKAAAKALIPFVVIELDPAAIEKAKTKGDPIVFGDATNEVILKHVHIQEARVVVIAISSNEATRRIIKTIRMYTETAYIIVRTRYVKEVEDLIKLGADEVIPEEFETSIEIFTKVLKKYLVQNDEIQGFVNEIRAHNYEILRGSTDIPSVSRPAVIHIPEMEIATLPIQQENNKIIGKTIQKSAIRTSFGVTILAIKRKDKYITQIKPDDIIKTDDILYVFGKPDDIIRINKFFLMNT